MPVSSTPVAQKLSQLSTPGLIAKLVQLTPLKLHTGSLQKHTAGASHTSRVLALAVTQHSRYLLNAWSGLRLRLWLWLRLWLRLRLRLRLWLRLRLRLWLWLWLWLRSDLTHI